MYFNRIAQSGGAQSKNSHITCQLPNRRWHIKKKKKKIQLHNFLICSQLIFFNFPKLLRNIKELNERLISKNYFPIFRQKFFVVLFKIGDSHQNGTIGYFMVLYILNCGWHFLLLIVLSSISHFYSPS